MRRGKGRDRRTSSCARVRVSPVCPDTRVGGCGGVGLTRRARLTRPRSPAAAGTTNSHSSRRSSLSAAPQHSGLPPPGHQWESYQTPTVVTFEAMMRPVLSRLKAWAPTH